MIFAFDIDGTITRFPKEMAEIMRGLRLAGNRVVVLTGKQTIEDYPQAQNPDRLFRFGQLASLGLHLDQHFDELFIACGPVDQGEGVGKAKAKILKELGANMFIDDAVPYVNAVRFDAPEVPVLYVVP